jgi:hypothetical protein
VERKILNSVRYLGLTGAKHKTALLGHKSLHSAEQITVKRDLKYVFGPGVMRELGVPWFVRPGPPGAGIFDAHKEVRVA